MCWGQNSSGQLGVASFSATAHGDEAGEEPGVANTYVTRPSEALTITQMSIGSSHACAILSDGDLYCWGSNVNGQLGVGDNISTDSMSTPVDLGDVEVIDVAAGGNHTCALLTNGDVWCWGLDSSGELGDGANDPQNAPTVAVDFADVAATKIVTGLAHSCALLESNAVYCWGDNSSGQLGDNNGGVDSNVPSGVTLAMGDVLDLDAGGLFTCAIVGTNVYCWGENGSGQLGNNDGTNTDLDVPSAALDIDGETPVKLALGGEHGCVLTSTGKVYCWGESDAGQTGQNDVTDDLAPLLVTTTGFTVTDIAAGNDHVCVILLPDDVDDLSRHIRCWGESGVGQLGLGGISDIGDDEVVDNASYDVDVVSTEPVP
jgi:alpha-tubulin suppressor-like RCC1 family protein